MVTLNSLALIILASLFSISLASVLVWLLVQSLARLLVRLLSSSASQAPGRLSRLVSSLLESSLEGSLSLSRLVPKSRYSMALISSTLDSFALSSPPPV